MEAAQLNDFIEHAKNLTTYFERLTSQKKSDWAERWDLSFEASCKWLAMLEHGAAVDQAIPFWEYLDRERVDHGSGWHDLRQEVRRWLYANGVDVYER